MHSNVPQLALNLYGPFRGAGIRIKYISDDWREMHVAMKMRWYNRNIAGVHFGGSLYAMADPEYMLMLSQILGKDYIVWDKAAKIEYIKPGKGTVTAKFAINEKVIDDIKTRTRDGEKYLPTFHVNIFDTCGDLVAKIEKTLYIRKKQTAKNRTGVHQ